MYYSSKLVFGTKACVQDFVEAGVVTPVRFADVWCVVICYDCELRSRALFLSDCELWSRALFLSDCELWSWALFWVVH